MTNVFARGAVWTGAGYFAAGNAEAQDVTLAAIARGLSRRARYGGFTIGENAYSVAQHCVLMVNLAGDLGLPDQAKAVCLLHDGAEGLLGVDMVSPLKRLPEVAGYRDIEDRTQAAVWERFNLTTAAHDWAPIWKGLDHVALAIEKRELLPEAAGKWPGVPEMGNGWRLPEVWTAAIAEDAFLSVAASLGLEA